MTWAVEQKSYSQRRACGLVGLAPKTYRYRFRRPDDARLRQRWRELALERHRFGYQRLLILLRLWPSIVPLSRVAASERDSRPDFVRLGERLPGMHRAWWAIYQRNRFPG